MSLERGPDSPHDGKTPGAVMNGKVSEDDLLAIGVMTGNSLDGADLVLTRFAGDGRMQDLCAHSVPMPEALGRALRETRAGIQDARGEMSLALRRLDRIHPVFFFATERAYTEFVAGGVHALLARAASDPAITSSH